MEIELSAGDPGWPPRENKSAIIDVNILGCVAIWDNECIVGQRPIRLHVHVVQSSFVGSCSFIIANLAGVWRRIWESCARSDLHAGQPARVGNCFRNLMRQVVRGIVGDRIRRAPRGNDRMHSMRRCIIKQGVVAGGIGQVGSYTRRRERAAYSGWTGPASAAKKLGEFWIALWS